jgi:multiple sugar transport system substrate-binding protein
MTQAGTLRGMAWDHPRARNPLEAISAEWTKTTGVAVQWDARPLKDFEDQPLAELAATYDLVLLDYPFTGTAATSGLIVPVDDWVDAAYLADQAEHAVGPS